MAVKNCDELSNMISLSVISGDEDLAKYIADLSARKRDALMRAGKLKSDDEVEALTGWSAHELELKANSADIEMRAIVQAKILSNDVRAADAYRELALQIKREGGTISRGVDALEMLRNASPADLEQIAKEWGGTYVDDPVQAINEMKQAIAETVSANYSIRQYSEIKGKGLESLRKQLRNKEISQGVFEDEVKKLHKTAMEQIAKGENPNKFVKLDEEWDAIKKIFGDDPVSAGKAWSQFIMARELLSDGGIDDGVLKAFQEMGAENLTGDLTFDQIAEYGKDDLDKLLARAYTNTEQLYNDGMLRQAYRDKLIELTSGMRVTKENMEKAKSIMNTMEFAEKGAAFADIVTADNAARSAHKRGIKVKNGTQLLHGIKSFARKMEENPDILKNPIEIAGAEFQPIDLIQIIYDITGDENILKVLRLGFLPDGTVLSVATSSLLGGSKEAAEKILRLFSKAKEAAKVSSVRDVSLKAITGVEIKEGAPMAFFDFRSSLYRKDELNRKKADFYDKLASRNKMKVDSTNIGEIKDTDDVSKMTERLKPYKGGYIIVNDSQWRTNSTFSKALDDINKDLKDEEKIWAIAPRDGLNSSFSMENGQLFYKTLDDNMYKDVSGTISIQTLGEATPTREILASAYEAATGRNGDKIRYQPSYTKGGVDNLGRQISDQQVDYGFVTDDNGAIRTFYHWTPYEFDTFDISHFRTGSGDSWMRGFYFATQSEDKIIMNPDEANRLIEVYLKADNAIPASDKLSKYMTRGDLENFVRELNPGVFDEFAGNYVSDKINKIWRDGDGTISDLFYSVNSSNWGALFPDGQAATDFFRAKLGIDGIWETDGVLVVFSPEQIKYVDNRLPTSSADMRFERRLVFDEDVFRFMDQSGIEYIKKAADGFFGGKVDMPFDEYMNFQINHFLKLGTKYGDAMAEIFFRLENEEAFRSIKTMDDIIPLFDNNAKIWITPYKSWVIPGTGSRFLPDDMKFMRMGPEEGRINSLEKVRDLIFPEVSYDGRSFREIVSDVSFDTVPLYQLLSAVRFMGKGRHGDFREARALAESQIRKRYGEKTADHFLKKLSEIDMSKISIKDNVQDPLHVAEAFFEYSFGSLDESRIGKLISKNGRVNRKAFEKLSHDEQIEVVNRLLQFDELYFTRYSIDHINGVRGSYSDKLVEKGNQLVREYGLNPYIQRGITNDVKLNDFISLYTDRGYLPHEVGINTDANNNVLSVTLGLNSVNWQSDYQDFVVEGIVGSKRFHNHPNGSFFSESDLANTNKGIDVLGLILPGGVVLEFPNNEEFRRLYKEYSESIRVGEGANSRSATVFEDAIFKALRISQEMGIVDKQQWGVFEDIIKSGSQVSLDAKTEKAITDEVLEQYYDMENWIIDSLTPEGYDDVAWQRQLSQYSKQKDVNVEDAMKVQMFTKDRTWKQIADGYGFPVKIVEGNMIEGTAAWGAWGRGFIWFTDMVKTSTAPHELFHAIFNTYVGPEQYNRVLADSAKLFQVSTYEAEEILADSFAEWFNTGKFTYGDKLKAIGTKKRLTKEQKTFLQQVKDFFVSLAETLGLVDAHRAEVEQMFDDMVNMRYLPDAGTPVNATEAMIKYNDELNATAARYFGEMLGEETPEVVSSEYIDRVQTLLSERLGIDIKAFDQINDKAALWRKIDQQFALERVTTGRYDRHVIDINSVKNEIEGMSEAELEKAIKKDLGDVMIKGTIKGNEKIAHIREAYLDYKTAGNAMDSLMSKGKIVSLANGGTAQTMSMQDMRNMFTNGTFEQTYKKMFLADQKVTDKDMKLFVSAINNNIFDTLSITFAENLVRAGYSLPLMNIKTFIYDYLRGNLDLNNKFVEAFLYKNNIPFSSDGLKSIVDTLMPAEFKFDYEDALFKGRFGELEQGTTSAVFETKNRFLQDSYSAIASIEMARAGEMPVNYEEDILKGILDKYINEVYNGVKDGTLTFQQAQGLKQEAGYALDMFEQDFLLPRYGRFLSKPERQGIMGMKYLLPIGVKGQNAEEVGKELREIRAQITEKYQKTLGNVARNNDINMSILRGIESEDDKMQKIIDQRRQQLIDTGGIIREVNGQYLVYDVKQALADTIAQLPDNIGGLEGIKALGRAGIEGLSSKQAYGILRYIEAAKGLSSTANLATDLIYKQNPRLLQYNFFQAYKVGDQGLPMALEGNVLNMDKYLSKFDNISTVDTDAKNNIFTKIVNKFRQQGHITAEDLDNIIDAGIKEAESSFRQIQLSPKQVKEAKNRMKLVYKKVFEPYVHVRDIPKGGVLIDGKTTVRDVKQKVADTMKQQYQQAIDDLEAMGIDDVNNIQTALYIMTNDGSKLSVKEAGAMSIDSWKKNIFNDENIVVTGADELKKFEGSPDDDALVKKQKERRNNIISQYEGTLGAMLNQTEYITKAESGLMTAFMNDVRTTMRQSTLTNKIVDALDALSGLNEEAARGIKDYLIGWKGNVSFGKWKPGQILKRMELVRDAYSKYYVMEISKLNGVKPSTRAEDLALRLAKYFKNIERLLGSADGLTGCTTSEQLNRAFYHIGQIVMNVDTVKGVFGLLSGVEQNQVLKFFKFAKGTLRKDADVFIRSGKGTFQESLGGYRDYVEEISGISRDDFNRIFASNFSERDFKRILQGLTGFSLTGDGWGRTAMKVLNTLNGSNYIFRFFMSYPGQLLTIPQQSLAYFLKQIGFERELGVESMSDVDTVRMHYGVLDGAYNELGSRGKSSVSPDDLRLDSYYNRYGIPDVDEIYRTTSIETSDDYINMYAKIDNHAASSISATNKWFRQLDPYKDNANNIIDGIFARNFKNIAFLKAIRGNDLFQFGTAKEFMSFMDDPRISAEVKTRLMDRVSAYSGRNFRNMLGLGFGGIDRPVAGRGFGNIMYGLMQLLNFRGSWGQNIFKQTGANITTALKMLTTSKGIWSREGREAMAEYIATQPEFINFVGALFNDLKRTRRLQRFQDNGRRPDDDNFYDNLDFIEYMTDTLNMTSQWFQGLQSFGPLRPFEEQARSIFASHMNPTIYKDTFGVGAWFNALGKNLGRQWKPVNWIAKWIGAWATDGPEGASAYLQSERRKLSFGSLRYMVNEDQNNYGYTYEMTGQTGGIPSILMGESKLNSDKNFTYEIDNTETWETLGQVFNGDVPRDARRTYMGNLGKALINGSQLLSIGKSLWKAATRDAPSYFSGDELADTMQKTDAGLEFYRTGTVTPRTAQEAELFFNTMLANAKYRPGSSSFVKSLIQYEDYGHMNGKEKGNKADAEMELWLDHMKHLTNAHGEFETHGGEKVVDPSWQKLVEDVRIHGYNSTYTTNLIYNYAKNWLNNHSKDPNYQLYIKMLGQGQAHNLIEYKTDQLIKALNVGKKGKDNKWTEKELGDVGLDTALLLQLGNSKIEGENVTLFDKLQVLDEDDATIAALQIIQSQAKGGDRKILDKFFEVEEQDDGTKVVSLKWQYENTLKQIGAISKAIDDGNVDLAVAEASSLVNMYKTKDPTGAVTATLIDSIYNRIYSTDSLSPEQKQAAMTALFHKNKEFIQRNPEKLRELLGDNYDLYARYMNSMLYQRDGMVISNLESMQSSGKGSSSKSKAASQLSSGLKNLANAIGGSGGNGGTRSAGSYKQRIPVVIKGADLVKELGLKGYSPDVNDLKVSSYKPHVDFSVSKDVNRNVKGPKTQTISNKKQLSNIETKTEKALEAEN